MSVGQAQSKIDAREFAEWQAYYTIEPFGEERADYRNAILCTLIANALRGKHGRRAKPKDFMLDFTAEQKPQTLADMRSLMNLYTELHNRKHG